MVGVTRSVHHFILCMKVLSVKIWHKHFVEKIAERSTFLKLLYNNFITCTRTHKDFEAKTSQFKNK